jgi:hypothetical protein
MIVQALIQPAAHEMVSLERQKLWLLFGADGQVTLQPRLTARGKAATGGKIDQIWHGTRDDIQPIFDFPQHRDGGDQSLRIGMTGIGEQGCHIPLLDNPAGIHHGHPVRHLGDDAQVMGDQDDGGAGLCPQHPQQVEDLSLDRDI